MILPQNINFAIVQGTTGNFTITLTSGTSNIPINLTGYSAKLVVGPYVALNSTNITASGGLLVGGTTGVIQVVMSGIATNIFSPQPYYIGLTAPNGKYDVVMNGTMNFISPFNRAIPPPHNTYIISGQDVVISVAIFDDLTPVAQPPPVVSTTGGVYGNITNG